MSGQRPGVADQLPASRRRDTAGVADTQIPGMRLRHRGQWSDHRRGVGVDKSQRRHGIVRAPGPAAATGNIHAPEITLDDRCAPPDTRSRRGPDPEPLRSSPWPSGTHGDRAAAAICAGRCFRARFPAGAAGPSGSTWQYWRPTSRSNGGGRRACENSTSLSTRFRGCLRKIRTVCNGRPRSSPTDRSHWRG